MKGMFGGCSAVIWESEDKKHFWGRNFDFNRFDKGSGVLYLPQGTPVCAFRREGEAHGETYPAKYAALGMGTLSVPGAPVLYDGVNEAGLAGGQKFARRLLAGGALRENIRQGQPRLHNRRRYDEQPRL